jgi:hypothetical protein
MMQQQQLQTNAPLACGQALHWRFQVAAASGAAGAREEGKLQQLDDDQYDQ